jgi:hypothetical protein
MSMLPLFRNSLITAGVVAILVFLAAGWYMSDWSFGDLRAPSNQRANTPAYRSPEQPRLASVTNGEPINKPEVTNEYPDPPQPVIAISSSTRLGWNLVTTDDFSIEYPDGWFARDFIRHYNGGDPKLGSLNSGSVYSYDYNLFNAGAPLTRDKLKILFNSLDTSLDSRLVEFDSNPQMKKIKTLSINGQPAVAYMGYGEDTFNLFDGVESYIPVYVITKDNIEYTFSCALGNSTLIDWCEKIITTFKFK